MPWSLPLRNWQKEATRDWGLRRPDDFLAVVTPGGGKTLFAGAVSVGALEGGFVDQVVVAVPTTLLRTQWATDTKRDAGIELDSRYRTGERLSRDVHGAIVTYAQIGEDPRAFRRLIEKKKTLLITDEIHHAGAESSWGEALLTAGEVASNRLHLSGTPWKSNQSKVAFLKYAMDGYVQADYVYTYADGLRDKIVRPIVTYLQSAEVEWQTADGVRRRATFEEHNLSKAHEAERLRAVLSHEGWVAEVIARAHAITRGLRKHEGDVGALAITMNAAHARFVANILREVVGVDPAVVLSEDPESDEVLARFKSGSEPWLVAVAKVAEGVDIKRLRVEAYLTNKRTEQHFRQASMRIARARNGRVDPAYLLLPSDPRLRELSESLEAEVKGFADPLFEESEGGEGVARDSSDSAFEVYGAQHRDGEVIVTSIRTVDPFESEVPAPTQGERDVVLVAHKKHELRTDLAKLAGKVASKFNLNRQDVYAWWKYQTRRGVDDLSAEELLGRKSAMQSWLDGGRCPVTAQRSR